MLKDLWDLAQGLVGLKDSFAKAKRERKDRIAEYFTSIGFIIQEAADTFKKGDVPHGTCQRMLPDEAPCVRPAQHLQPPVAGCP